MATEDEKAEIEVRVFNEFLQRAGLPIDPSSVSKRNPPEPDISCFHQIEGQLAFELVEICDQNIAKAISSVTDEAFWTSDPTPNILNKKRSRFYRSLYLVDLLMYINGRTASPDDLIIAMTRRFSNKLRGRFRRVWFLGRQKAYLICDFGLR